MSWPKALFALLLFSLPIWGKRAAPDEIPPITYHGIIYTAPHFIDEGRKTIHGGIIEAQDSATGKLVGRFRIYEYPRIPLLEGDVQDVFIRAMTLDSSSGTLRILDERGQQYALDLSHPPPNARAGWVSKLRGIAAILLLLGLAYALRPRIRKEFQERWGASRGR